MSLPHVEQSQSRKMPILIVPNHRKVPVLDTGSALLYLRARFFGHFELLYGDEGVDLGRNVKALAILKYLLSHLQRPVSQDYLMDWLWPESDPRRARWSLNSAVHALRKLLKDELPTAPSSKYVLFDKGYYRFDPSVQLWTDTEEFRTLYERGRRLERTRRIPEAVAEYEEAIELYRGDYLIEDLYEDWTMVEREWFTDAYMDMLERLADYYKGTQRYQDSIRTCYRLLEKDYYHEESHRLLMECQARLGLRGRALRQYRLLEGMLKRDWETAPQPETRNLYQRLLGR